MARIRSVHPSLFTDEAWVSCSPLARILAIGLWTDADDQGVFEWKPLQIKMRLLPGDDADVPELLRELSDAGLVRAYESDGKKYGAIRNFRKHQRPQKPTAIHPLPADIAAYVGLSDTGSEPVRDQSRSGTGNAKQMEDGGVEEDKNPVVANNDGPKQPSPEMVRRAFDAWNETAKRYGLPQAIKLDRARLSGIRKRLSEDGEDGWLRALAAVGASKHCRGENDRAWKADLDFLLQDKSWRRLLEGFYGGRVVATATRDPPRPATPEQQAARLRRFHDTGEWFPAWGPAPEPARQTA